MVTESSPSAADLDAQIVPAADSDDFDPTAVYVVMVSAIALPYGPERAIQEPAMHGDYIAAQPGDGVIGLACVELKSPGDSNTVVQKASDGTDALQRLWSIGRRGRAGEAVAIHRPEHPVATEARRNRVLADSYSENGERWGDPRLNIVANGGRVTGYASGVKVG